MEYYDKIAVIGLGYVGLPVAVAFSRAFDPVIGFDINAERIKALKDGRDETGEIDTKALSNKALKLTNDPKDIKYCNVFIVTVPTPIDENNQPDLTPLISASKTVGAVLKKGDLVVYESTVYPGVTEDICGPILEESSGLKCGVDFTLGYSPERINPGDKEHRLETITKVVSGQDDATLETVAKLYDSIIEAGVFRAASIKVAEAAKVIENTQRDLNVALMNELSLIFDKLNIRTADVLEAAGTKWNFLPFTPGLVGGHCISVDPYYLTTCAESLGYNPEVILAGRRINNEMGTFVAQKSVKMLVKSNLQIRNAKTGILGLTFKENVPDLRNSRVPDIIAELKEFGIEPLIHDPLADASEVENEYDITLCDMKDLENLDLLILAVPHQSYLDQGVNNLCAMLKPEAPFIDLKSVFSPSDFLNNRYWSL